MFIILLCIFSNLFAMNDPNFANELKHQILISCIKIVDSPSEAILLYARLSQVNKYWYNFLNFYKSSSFLPMAATGDDNPPQKIPTAEIISFLYGKFKQHADLNYGKIAHFLGAGSIDWIEEFSDTPKETLYKKCFFDVLNSSYLPLLQWLNSKKFNFYQKDENGWFPIVYAIKERNKDVTKFLLGKGTEEHLATLFFIKEGATTVKKTLLTLIREWGDQELNGLASGTFKRHKQIGEAQKTDTGYDLIG